MKYYLAPMEGITGYIYRNTLAEVYGVPDKCFTPFLCPNENRPMNKRERQDVIPEHNEGLPIIPQVLTNNAEHFLYSCRELEEMGYSEVNLNLGCPSGTVVGKKRGSGFLSVPEELDRFLDTVFQKAKVKISVKTRLGITDPEEFYPILEIYNRYPMEELIVHPRVQKDFYKHPVRKEIWDYVESYTGKHLCYNGDLFTLTDIAERKAEFPGLERMMLGRGILSNPSLLRMQKVKDRGGSRQEVTQAMTTADELLHFHDLLVERYYQRMKDENNVMFKMKELWFYLIRSFEESERYAKKLRKVQRVGEYREIVKQLFEDCPLYIPKHLYF